MFEREAAMSAEQLLTQEFGTLADVIRDLADGDRDDGVRETARWALDQLGVAS